MRAEEMQAQAQARMQSKHHVRPNILPRKIIVLNWHGDHDSLNEALDDFSPPGTEVTFVGRSRWHALVDNFD